MTVLSDYTTQLKALLNDPDNSFYTSTNLTSWINQARLRVAAEAQCVRVLPISSSSITAIAVTAGGSGYSVAPTVTISGPDAFGGPFVQATATATVAAGAVTTINITNAGTGYVAPPTITITGVGTGATASATLSAAVKTVVAQENYSFSTWNIIIQATNPGVQSIIGVQTISVSWGSQKPTLGRISWSDMQAYLRAYNIGYLNYPTYWAQYGQGVNGTATLWPIPSVVTQLDVDCYCLPITLTSDASVEAIPYPWTDAVPYYAAYLAYLNAQRKDDARYYLGEYKRLMAEGRMFVSPSVVPSFYDGM